MSSTALPTIGTIAKQLGQPLHRVDYIVRTRGIQPTGRAGHVRVFTDADVKLIAEELRRIDELGSPGKYLNGSHRFGDRP